MSNNISRLIFIISAPSGTGKTTLIHRVMARDPKLAFSVSHTTRPPRKGEVNGRDYYFVSRDEFQRLVSEDAFIEWANVYGELYGTSKREIERLSRLGKDAALDIDVQGALQAMKRLDRRHWVSIFIHPPDLKTLRQRLTSRGIDPLNRIKKRHSEAMKELSKAHLYDYQIVNDILSRATEQLINIITSEREKKGLS